MGCESGKTVDSSNNSNTNNGYPMCKLTIPLTMDVDALTAISDDKIILGGIEELQLFDGETKTISQISKEHNGRINCLIKLSDGRLASGGQDNTIKVWDIEKKQTIFTLKGHTSIIWDIREIEGNKLISASDDNKSKIWDLNQKKEICTLFSSHRHISAIAVLKNNRIILSSGRQVILFNLNTKQQESCLDIKKGVWSLKALSNGDVAAGLGNGSLYIIQVTDELIIKTIFCKGHKKTINSIIELDNHKIVTASDENDLILWDPNEPESMFLIRGHTDFVTCLCFISGNRFASASRDKTLKIWE
jgi:WD40 repeat protein